VVGGRKLFSLFFTFALANVPYLWFTIPMSNTTTTKPEGTTHTSGTTHFKRTGTNASGEALVCKWIKTRQAWSKPQAYINFPA
jgi:hypothetical protein